ncbi:hypothetical protein L246_16345 [Salmonella enterica subsp. enterica serovar Worthington str. BCH-5715]|nr:hypothetical protein L246_16345 [Salmonella enterica subsp. enterica serovar Worthington str. BCH-5715]
MQLNDSTCSASRPLSMATGATRAAAMSSP